MLRNIVGSRRDIEAATGVTQPLLEPISPDSNTLKLSSRASSTQDGAMKFGSEFAQPASVSRQTGKIMLVHELLQVHFFVCVNKKGSLTAERGGAHFCQLYTA
jgi:hypothetical protein